MLYVIGVYLARKNLILFCGGLYNVVLTGWV
jgi:hypothetical protein